jgi:hypothetical protein
MTPSRRRRVAPGDVLLGLAALALVAALAHPRVERALLWRRVAAAQADVDAVLAAAADHQREEGSWPVTTPSGEVPSGLEGRLPPGFSFQGSSYTLEWSCWEAVDSVAAAASVEEIEPTVTGVSPTAPVPRLPPPGDSVTAPVPVDALGAVTVHADDERMLKALLERYGAARSFVRERSWTLVLPAPAAGSPGGSR